MAADLFALNETTKDIPGLTIERVVDSAGLSAWMDTWIQLDDEAHEPRERLYASLGLDGEQKLRHYLARLDGRPVATSQLFLGGEAAGIYCVTTIPEAQRRGIGTAVVLAPLLDARALGYRVAVLGPTPEAQHMYARMGFELFPSPLVAYSLWNEM
jgi:GNAT superfamily N-acetyltransferase